MFSELIELMDDRMELEVKGERGVKEGEGVKKKEKKRDGKRGEHRVYPNT